MKTTVDTTLFYSCKSHTARTVDREQRQGRCHDGGVATIGAAAARAESRRCPIAQPPSESRHRRQAPIAAPSIASPTVMPGIKVPLPNIARLPLTAQQPSFAQLIAQAPRRERRCHQQRAAAADGVDAAIIAVA